MQFGDCGTVSANVNNDDDSISVYQMFLTYMTAQRLRNKVKFFCFITFILLEPN